MNTHDKILVVGDRHLVGKRLVQMLREKGFKRIITESGHRVDFLKQDAVDTFFRKENPRYVFLIDVKSGGIIANIKYPGEFIYKNIQVQNNVIHSSLRHKTKKLFFLASSCVYPRLCPQPIQEKYLFSGRVEETNEPFAIAKLAGITMCQAYRKQYGVNFISAVPATPYGPGDDYDLENSHVISALLRKFHEAKVRNQKEVVVWGTGKPRREFVYADDVARACLFLMQKYNKPEIINIGSGEDLTIKALASLIKKSVGFKGKIVFNTTKPDGIQRKLLDSKRINALAWKPKVSLQEGVRLTYKDYLNNFRKTT